MEGVMKDSTFEIDQIAKLREIERARMRRGEPGLREELQSLILRLQSGGVGPKSDDPRVVQAKRLWDKGFGKELGFDSFDAYLATIPEVPEVLKVHDELFPELVLVDARVGITKSCELLGIDYEGDDDTFVDYDLQKVRCEKTYWVRLQDGERNRGNSVHTSRSGFIEGEIGLTVHEGLAFFAQNDATFVDRGMDLVGSVCRGNRHHAAYLSSFYGPKLLVNSGGRGDPLYGASSRRVSSLLSAA
jgi:hypothetical protein